MKRIYSTLTVLLFVATSVFASSNIVIRTKPIPGVPLTKITPVKANNNITIKEVNAQKVTKKTVIRTAINNKKAAALNEYNGPIKSTFTPSLRVTTDTLYYWDPSASDYFYYEQPDSFGDYNYGVRFTPTHSGTLNSAGFWFYDLYGSGDVTVHVWDDSAGNPNNELGSVAVNTSNIDTSGYETVVDLSSLGISVNTSSDFYITYTVGSGIDSLGLFLDTVGTAPSRCYDYYPSNGWETSDWIHSNITWLVDAYVDESSSSSLPNLAPYQPTGWSSSLVCAVDSLHDTTATTNDTLNAGDTSYVSMAFINNGSGDVTDTCYFYLYVDGTATSGWYVSSLQSNYYVPIKHAKILISSSGTHAISDTADATHRITESDETDNGTSQNYYWKNSSSSLPNLAPYTPSGWSSSLVCAVDSLHDTTATTNDTLNAGDTSYVSLAFINNGAGDVTDTCYFYLYVDGTATKGWYAPSLQSGHYVYIEHTKILVSSAGTHAISDTADATHRITESDETDNGTSQNYYWKGSVAGKNLTPYTPSGWDAPVVVSSVTGTHTNGPSYFADSTSYIDWAVKNTGTDDITDSFYVYLYVDGSPVNGWQINGLKADSIASVSDYSYQFSEGSHTVGIFADSTNTVSETDENDNKYSHSFTFTAGGGTGYTGNAEYIIITDPSFVDAFQPLARWKTQKGIPTKIVTTDSIYNNFSGYDNAEKIRNFIKAARDSGAQYILLGGQCDYEHGEEFVPRRNIYFTTIGANDYPDEDTIISDMYYSNLDGTWDGNGNHTYGEDNDNVDFYSDIFVGRAPVKTVAQVTNFVNKVINYEKNPPSGFIKKILLPSVQLFDASQTGYDYYGYTVNNHIADLLPSGWEAAKLEDNNESPSWNLQQAVIDSTDAGFEFIHHADHGNEDGFYYHYGDFVYSFSDADTASNGNKLSIVNAISCFTGAMDENSGNDNGNDCVAEHFVNNTSGGAIATILNSRYGLGPQQQGQMGYSEDLDTTFYDRIFLHGEYHIGEVVSHMRDQWASTSSSDDAAKWCTTELNLLGDPEMPIWTDNPANFIVTVDPPDSIPQNKDDTVTVSVTDASKALVDNATVTFANDGLTIYDTTHTTNGVATVVLHPTTKEIIYITITKHNYIPSQKTINIGTNGIVEKVNGIGNKSNRIVNTKDGFRVELASRINGQINVNIIGLNGRVARSINENATGNSLFVSNKGLPTGVYFIRLHNGSLNKAFKVSVIR